MNEPWEMVKYRFIVRKEIASDDIYQQRRADDILK